MRNLKYPRYTETDVRVVTGQTLWKCSSCQFSTETDQDSRVCSSDNVRRLHRRVQNAAACKSNSHSVISTTTVQTDSASLYHVCGILCHRLCDKSLAADNWSNNWKHFYFRVRLSRCITTVDFCTIKIILLTRIHIIIHKHTLSTALHYCTVLVDILQQAAAINLAVRSAVVSRTKTRFSRRAFSVCGPDIWNNLLINLRLIDSRAVFQHALNTHLLNMAFSS